MASRPEVEAYAVRPLLSVKYLLSPTTRQFVEDDGRTKMPGYTFLEEQNGFDIYENENYIPYGFTYDYYMTYAECDSYEEDQRSLLMLKAMLLTDEQVERHGDILTDLGADYRVSGSTAGGLQGTDLSGLTAEEIMSQAREEASSIPELDCGRLRRPGQDGGQVLCHRHPGLHRRGGAGEGKPGLLLGALRGGLDDHGGRPAG